MSDMEVDQPPQKGKEKKESGKPRFEVKKVGFHSLPYGFLDSGVDNGLFQVECCSAVGMG